MRFLIALTAFAASAYAADTVGSLATDIAGDCAGKCFASAIEGATSCGDPFSGDSSSCYCGLTEDDLDVSSLSGDDTVSCLEKCNLSTSDIENMNELQTKLQDFCNENSASTLVASKVALLAGGLVLLGLAL